MRRLVLIAAGVAEAFVHVEVLRRNVAVFCLTAAAAGFLSWIIGQFSEVKRAQLDHAKDGDCQNALGEHPLLFLRSLRYWGMILVVSTLPVYSFSSLRHSRATDPRASVADAKPAVVFPPLELHGLILNGAKSSAIINGEVLFIGEGIGTVQLISVDGEQVTVALEGQTKVLSMRK